jgi:hypothetical protein
MKKIDLGQTISILANLGVIAGIVFLGVELQQNNELLRIETRNNGMSRLAGNVDIQLDNPYLFELSQKDMDTLTPAERAALITLGIRLLSTYQTAYDDRRQGLSDGEISLRRVVSDSWRNAPAMQLAWARFSERGDPEFVAWMEEIVINGDK